uniref:ATP synthase subunit 8 n=1 Tax=Mindarus keteleerifoliae TaxID=1078267 RepID=A0A1L1YMX9_9HEMI|nr:ATP synthase F0 subunit 8 [Mindarus keteleerifoliae]AKM70082.1 ATP synthase subunit 8 [Mindarus keteleerifoliae]
MAPMNWLILFLYFFTTFFMIMSILYFIFIKKFKMKILKLKYIKNYNKFI